MRLAYAIARQLGKVDDLQMLAHLKSMDLDNYLRRIKPDMRLDAAEAIVSEYLERLMELTGIANKLSEHLVELERLRAIREKGVVTI